MKSAKSTVLEIHTHEHNRHKHRVPNILSTATCRIRRYKSVPKMKSWSWLAPYIHVSIDWMNAQGCGKIRNWNAANVLFENSPRIDFSFSSVKRMGISVVGVVATGLLSQNIYYELQSSHCRMLRIEIIFQFLFRIINNTYIINLKL